jgi:hypothetical protein
MCVLPIPVRQPFAAGGFSINLPTRRLCPPGVLCTYRRAYTAPTCAALDGARAAAAVLGRRSRSRSRSPSRSCKLSRRAQPPALCAVPVFLLHCAVSPTWPRRLLPSAHASDPANTIWHDRCVWQPDRWSAFHPVSSASPGCAVRARLLRRNARERRSVESATLSYEDGRSLASSAVCNGLGGASSQVQFC